MILWRPLTNIWSVNFGRSKYKHGTDSSGYRRLFAQSDGGGSRHRSLLMTHGDAKRNNIYVTKQPHYSERWTTPPPILVWGTPWFLTLKRWQSIHILKACYIFSIVKHTHFCWDFLCYFESSCRGKYIVPKQIYLESWFIKGPILSPADITSLQSHWYLLRRTSSPIFQHQRDLLAGTFQHQQTTEGRWHLQSNYRFSRQGPIF